MLPYQEEYLANVMEFVSLNLRPGAEDQTLEAYMARMADQQKRREQLIRRNMELLPALDQLADADQEERQSLQEFSSKLLANPHQVDVGVACKIQEVFVALARLEKDRAGLIEHLYHLGMARFNLSNKLVNMAEAAAPYYEKVRACFREVASYLEQFAEIGDDATRGFIIRSFANQALGQFPTVGERTRKLKKALEIMQDPYYRGLAPNLPWNQYVRATHQLMVTSLSHSRERAMTAQDVADIVRSVNVVYRGSAPSPKKSFHTATTEFYCGIRSLDYLLEQLRKQIDAASGQDFSHEGMYALVSVSAFYCQYLTQYPERIGERERRYVAELYQRIQAYLDAFPPEMEDENLFFYLRQIICTFVETKDSIPCRDFLHRLLFHFTPEVYIHSRTVAEAAKVLCGAVLDRDPAFFDGIPFLGEISDPERKRAAALDYAGGCGLFHDVGKVNCLEIHTRIARQWFPAEGNMASLHTLSGYDLLLGRPSTSRYASAALGHHAWYDGSADDGYRAVYQRGKCPERRMVDVIALADWLERTLGGFRQDSEPCHSFEESVGIAASLGGRRFSPRLTALLGEAAVVSALRQALESGQNKAFREIYQSAKG